MSPLLIRTLVTIQFVWLDFFLLIFVDYQRLFLQTNQDLVWTANWISTHFSLLNATLGSWTSMCRAGTIDCNSFHLCSTDLHDMWWAKEPHIKQDTLLLTTISTQYSVLICLGFCLWTVSRDESKLPMDSRHSLLRQWIRKTFLILKLKQDRPFTKSCIGTLWLVLLLSLILRGKWFCVIPSFNLAILYSAILLWFCIIIK